MGIDPLQDESIVPVRIAGDEIGVVDVSCTVFLNVNDLTSGLKLCSDGRQL